PYADYSSERLYAFLRAYHPEKAAPQPGEYSNLGVGLLGHLLERMYGISYAELVRAKITGPLGMEDTIVELTREQEQRFVTPHSGASVVSPWRLTSMAGAGALRSTAADLVKFVRALLDPRSVIAPAWQIARKPRAAFGRRGQIGLGIMIAPRGDQTIYHHSGGTGGFRTYLEIAANDSRGTVVLLNNDTLEPAVIVAAVRRPAPVADAARRMPPEVAATPDELRAFTGVYAIDSRGRFTVVLDEAGRLRIRLTGQAFLPVRYAGQDRCFNSAVAAQFRFSRDATGRVDGLVLQQNGEEVSARRTADAPTVRFLPLEKLRDYAGSYVLAPGQVFEISATPLTLVAKLTGQPAFPVHCTSEDRFVYDVVEAALTFERDASGAVVALVLHQGGLDQRATKQAKP
ncbi:MAG TPA: serine hydrolase, partial [Acidobacteriota bacterium]|nr:serine hydrolase [Acidobacteriota bacterium]